MRVSRAVTLKRGTEVIVKGTVRNVTNNGKWIEVQFSTYSLDFPAKDVRLKSRRREPRYLSDPIVIEL